MTDKRQPTDLLARTGAVMMEEESGGSHQTQPQTQHLETPQIGPTVGMELSRRHIQRPQHPDTDSSKERRSRESLTTLEYKKKKSKSEDPKPWKTRSEGRHLLALKA